MNKQSNPLELFNFFFIESKLSFNHNKHLKHYMYIYN